ncbi:MAG: hypothetical protein N3J91_04155 [Verrucomicrobiae bacterium]|nr:hypothetical protein [Verrucomicrobiae bacterium]
MVILLKEIMQLKRARGRSLWEGPAPKGLASKLLTFVNLISCFTWPDLKTLIWWSRTMSFENTGKETTATAKLVRLENFPHTSQPNLHHNKLCHLP